MPTVAIIMLLRAERQSVQMSKITNDGLTRSGTGCFIAVPIWQQWASKGRKHGHSWSKVLHWIFPAHFDFTPHKISVRYSTYPAHGSSFSWCYSVASWYRVCHLNDVRHELIIANVTLPQFRMRWRDEVKRKKRGACILMFADMLRRLTNCRFIIINRAT